MERQGEFCPPVDPGYPKGRSGRMPEYQIALEMMDPELIYCRTPEGERLARAPRQIASYSQRATLLLIDGQISVGELSRRFGETLPIDEALDELEAAGLIQAKGDGSRGTEWAPPEAPVADFHEDPLFDPSIGAITEERLVAEGASEVVIASLEEDLPADELDKLPPAPFLPPELPPDPDRSGPAGAVAIEPVDLPVAASGVPGSSPSHSAEDGSPRRFSAKTVALVLGVMLIAMAVWWFSGLRGRLENRASAALGVPVTIGGLGFAIQHGPGLALSDVRIQGPQPLHFPVLEVVSGVGGGGLARLVVSDVTLKPSDFAAMAALLAGQGAWTGCRFENVGVALGARTLGGLSGTLAKRDDGATVLSLGVPGGGFSFTAKPYPGQMLAITLTASPERLPILGGAAMATVELQGILSDTALVDGRVALTGYGGKWDGTLRGEWPGPVMFDATLTMTAVSANQVSRSLLDRGAVAEGVVNGTVTVRAQGANWDEVGRLDRLNAQFVVERGALKGFDLGEALRERVARPISGGETRFERLRGRLEGEPGNIVLRVDELDAGALQATGQLRIDEFLALKGQLVASVRVAGRGVLTYPAVLGGTVARPSIQLRLPASGGVVLPPGGAER